MRIIESSISNHGRLLLHYLPSSSYATRRFHLNLISNQRFQRAPRRSFLIWGSNGSSKRTKNVRSHKMAVSLRHSRSQGTLELTSAETVRSVPPSTDRGKLGEVRIESSLAVWRYSYSRIVSSGSNSSC
jgi:hypothetical protein